MRNTVPIREGRHVQFHARLNPKIWRNSKLRPLVRLKLFQTALAFYKFLDVSRLIVNDIIITGSNAAYNYTLLSDIDVHLIVDFSRTPCPSLVSDLFLAKKALWSDTYAVTIFGYPVELYVEDAAEPVKASGVYSILHDQWLKQPSPTPPDEDDDAVEAKLDAYEAAIDELLGGDPDVRTVDDMLKQIKKFRQLGLMKGGEFSVENCVFKSLRDAGYLQRLFDKRTSLTDRRLSLK